ncbi:MAG: Xaa-Pro peptidase family protein [Gammaproteobacteria bacterium]|nr:Xaa-Pro peptidase family protein [Gammaproteobacteria bacterium]
MSANPVEHLLFADEWSDVRRLQEMPEIDFDRMMRYRVERLRQQLREHDAAFCILVNPISLRYAVDYRSYLLFQSHIPQIYLFVPQEGPLVVYGCYYQLPGVEDFRPGRPHAFFDGGTNIDEAARGLADDVVEYLAEIGSSNRRVAVEYVNPSVTQALEARGVEVIDGVRISELARVIKSEDEIACMRWAVAVGEHGAHMMKQALRPGVTELQLFGLLNYTNIANNGDWHEGRMLASGPRINPWLQEASDRRVESGDLVGFDTDMVGPFGYFVDLSRTFHCGPAKPTRRQKQIYRMAVDEIEHNLKLVRPGMTLFEMQDQAYPIPEECRDNAYVCMMHAVGMCDEYPQVRQGFRQRNAYDCTLEAGMVVCIESYMGPRGERDGVKIEQQVLITDDGYELLTQFPYEESLLD